MAIIIDVHYCAIPSACRKRSRRTAIEPLWTNVWMDLIPLCLVRWEEAQFCRTIFALHYYLCVSLPYNMTRNLGACIGRCAILLQVIFPQAIMMLKYYMHKRIKQWLITGIFKPSYIFIIGFPVTQHTCHISYRTVGYWFGHFQQFQHNIRQTIYNSLPLLNT